MKDCLRIGNTTELEVQYLLVKNGYQVFTPVNDGCKVDLITIINGSTARVQIKTSIKTETSFAIPMYYGSKNKTVYTADDIDYFATTYKGELYLIPITDVTNRTRLTLIMDDNKNTTSNGIPMLKASKYLIN